MCSKKTKRPFLQLIKTHGQVGVEKITIRKMIIETMIKIHYENS